ncbi:MAG: GNAT family N-acetyltransferase [Mycobacteriales bacterium]
MREWPVAQVIETARLTLEPLRVEHAAEMAPALDDIALHRYIGGRPASVDQLWERYRQQSAGRSPDGTEGWLNWVIRHGASGTPVGTVQATVSQDGEVRQAELAWVVATPCQRQGYAVEAAAGMVGWLRERGIRHLVAHVHPEHRASQRVAERLGLTETDVEVEGETRWASGP